MLSVCRVYTMHSVSMQVSSCNGVILFIKLAMFPRTIYFSRTKYKGIFCEISSISHFLRMLLLSCGLCCVVCSAIFFFFFRFVVSFFVYQLHRVTDEDIERGCRWDVEKDCLWRDNNATHKNTYKYVWLCYVALAE